MTQDSCRSCDNSLLIRSDNNKTIRIEVAKCEVRRKRERLAKRFVNRRRNLGEGKISSIWFQTHLALCLHSCFTFAKRRSVFSFLLLRLTYVSPDPYLSRDRRKVSRGNFDSSERISFFNLSRFGKEARNLPSLPKFPVLR